MGRKEEEVGGHCWEEHASGGNKCLRLTGGGMPLLMGGGRRACSPGVGYIGDTHGEGHQEEDHISGGGGCLWRRRPWVYVASTFLSTYGGEAGE